MRRLAGLCLLALVMTGVSLPWPATADPAVVTTIPVGTAPTGVAINAVTDRAYVAGRHSVWVIDVRTNKVVDEIAVAEEAYPIAVNPRTNRIYAGSDGGAFRPPHGSISVIDGSSNRVISMIRVGPGPRGIAVNPRTNMIYVANHNGVKYLYGTVSVIDGDTNRVVAMLGRQDGIWDYPVDVAVNPRTNRIFVVTSGGVLFTVDGRSNEVIRERYFESYSDPAVAVNPRTNVVYVTDPKHKKVRMLDGETSRVLRAVRLDREPADVAVDSVRDLVHVITFPPVEGDEPGRLTLFEGQTLERRGSVPVGDGGWGVAVEPALYRGYITDPLGGAVVVTTEDGVPPVSSFSTENGAMLGDNETVEGKSTDDFSGVRRVSITFDSGGASSTVEAALDCDGPKRRSCTWSTPVPEAPGSYVVTAQGVDRAGTVESSGPSITIVRTA